jgi:hypothetical protein
VSLHQDAKELIEEAEGWFVVERIAFSHPRQKGIATEVIERTEKEKPD